MTLELLFPPIINAEGRKHILQHKYVPGVKSFTMPYLDVWWEIAVNCVPAWIAPNILTLTSLIICLLAFYVYSYFEPHFSGTYDSFYLYFYEFVTLFMYQTIDAIDGKHARNTSNSSPLGQLFDHGVDSIIISLSTSVHAGIIGMGTNWCMLYAIIMSQIVFYALNWRARHTSKFDLGQFSVDETMLLGQLVFILTAIYGTQFWKDFKIFGIETWKLLMISLTATIIQNCGMAFYVVNKHYNSVTTKEKLKFYNERFYELVNVFIFHISLCLWNTVGIFDKYPIMFISTIGFTFAHLIHRLIICDVTKQKSRKIQYIIIPFVIIGILSGFEYKFGYNLSIPIISIPISMKDFVVIFGVFIYSTYIMVVYAMRCMIDISNLLKIRIFIINAPKTHSS